MGKTESGDYIQLDIHKSQKVVEGLKYLVDIDSVIWKTDRLKVKESINIQLAPYKEMTAPIYKHNHTYVELYWPQTKDQVKRGEISSALRAVPISQLLNTHFSHFGRALRSPEVLIVFPWMKHKYPLRKVWEMKILLEVESF